MKKPNKTAKIGHYRVKPGDEIRIIIRHVSRSGMSRRMDFYLLRNNKTLRITGHVAELTGYKLSKDRTLIAGGCGMDMGFGVVYDLSRACFPRGFYIGKNDWPRNNCETIKQTRIDPDGGYALKHQYI